MQHFISIQLSARHCSALKLSHDYGPERPVVMASAVMVALC